MTRRTLTRIRNFRGDNNAERTESHNVERMPLNSTDRWKIYTINRFKNWQINQLNCSWKKIYQIPKCFVTVIKISQPIRFVHLSSSHWKGSAANSMFAQLTLSRTLSWPRSRAGLSRTCEVPRAANCQLANPETVVKSRAFISVARFYNLAREQSKKSQKKLN